MPDTIEVFQDLKLRGPLAQRPALRAALIDAAANPWRVDLERSAEVARSAITSEDVLLFRRQNSDDFPASGLTLWGTNDGYYIPNIVPLEMGSLTFTQYNAILADFITRVAEPVAARYGYKIETTKSHQTLDDWLPGDVALKLRRFSSAANKSTGASHPMDERRWFDFIVAAHRAGSKLDAGQLARWLHETENWDEDSAHELAGNYETSLALLTHYDEN